MMVRVIVTTLSAPLVVLRVSSLVELYIDMGMS